MLAFILSRRFRRSSRFTESPPPAVGGGAPALAAVDGGLSTGFVAALAIAGEGFCVYVCVCGGGGGGNQQHQTNVSHRHTVFSLG